MLVLHHLEFQNQKSLIYLSKFTKDNYKIE